MSTPQSLPAWLYTDPRFFELERDKIFRPAWHIMGHVNEAPNVGDYLTLEILGERVVTVRGEDNELRSYKLDGSFAGAPKWQGSENLADVGPLPVEQEIFQGFIFIRFEKGLPSVAEMMAPYVNDLAQYELGKLVPHGRVTLRPRSVNWKNVSDNYCDAMHITVAHPGLTRLFGGRFFSETSPWVDKFWGNITDSPSDNWSERAYQRLTEGFTNVPAKARCVWAYYKLWPNLAFDVYPDQIDFMQFIPISATKTLIREIPYVHPDANREIRAARYLNWRINRQVNVEDTALIEAVQRGMESSSYASGPLSPNEINLIAFGNRMRDLIPAASLERAPT